MKKQFLFLLLLAITMNLSAHGYQTGIGIKYNPGIATIYNSRIKNASYARFSQSGGIELSKLLSGRFYLETGLFLFDRGFQVQQHFPDINGNDAGIRKSREIEYYLTLPFSIRYNLNGFYLQAGPNINYYIARKFIVDGELISTDKAYQSSNILFGAQACIGYETKLSDRYLLTVDTYVNATLKARFLNYGLGVGVRYILEVNE